MLNVNIAVVFHACRYVLVNKYTYSIIFVSKSLLSDGLLTRHW